MVASVPISFLSIKLIKSLSFKILGGVVLPSSRVNYDGIRVSSSKNSGRVFSSTFINFP